MKYSKAKVLAALNFLFIFNLIGFVVSADPVVNNLTIYPETIDSTSTFTVSVNISGEDISIVNLTISGCNEDVCFTDLTQNIEMNLNSQGEYEAQISFSDPDEKANIIKYLFEITLEDGTEYRFSDPSWKTYINVNQNIDGNGETTQKTDDNNTPGFDLIFVLLALFISFLVYYKKR